MSKDADPRGYFMKSAGVYLPWRDFHMIRSQWNKGKPWFVCSLIYKMTRQQIAEVVTA